MLGRGITLQANKGFVIMYTVMFINLESVNSVDVDAEALKGAFGYVGTEACGESRRDLGQLPVVSKA